MPDVRGTEETAARLAALALHYREDVLGESQPGISARGGPSYKTVSKIENAASLVYDPGTLRALDRGLGWAVGSARRVFTGEAEDVTDQPPGGDDGAGRKYDTTHYPLPGSTSEAPDTLAPSYEILPGIWITDPDPKLVDMTPEERLALIADRLNRGLNPDA